MSKIFFAVCLFLAFVFQLALSIVIPDEVQISSVKTADVKAMSLVAKVLPELEEKSGNRWIRVIPISYQVIKTVNANDYFIKVYSFTLSERGVLDVYMVLRVRRTFDQPRPKLVSFVRIKPWDQLESDSNQREQPDRPEATQERPPREQMQPRP